MTIRYYSLKDGFINQFTESAEIAYQLNLDQITEEKIVYGYDGHLYLESECPEKPAPTEEEQKEKRADAYCKEVDPITSHIERLKDEDQTPEIEQKINELKEERKEKVEEIKEKYPYPEEVEIEQEENNGDPASSSV